MEHSYKVGGDVLGPLLFSLGPIVLVISHPTPHGCRQNTVGKSSQPAFASWGWLCNLRETRCPHQGRSRTPHGWA